MVTLRTARLSVVGVLLLATTACGSTTGGGSAKSTPTPSPTTISPGLAKVLVAPEDLAGKWQLSQKLRTFPGGRAGAIPSEYRHRLPTVDLCSAASATSAAAAAEVFAKWQVFTTLDQTGRGNFVSVAEMAYSDPGRVEPVFQALKDGMRLCFGKEQKGQTPTATWALPPVGNERTGQQASSTSGGATWTSHVALVRRGSVLVYIGVLEAGRAGSTLDPLQLAAIVSAAGSKLRD